MVTRLSYQITRATNSDTSAERDFVIAELTKYQAIAAARICQDNQLLPTERANHYATDGEAALALVVTNYI